MGFKINLDISDLYVFLLDVPPNMRTKLWFYFKKSFHIVFFNTYFVIRHILTKIKDIFYHLFIIMSPYYLLYNSFIHKEYTPCIIIFFLSCLKETPYFYIYKNPLYYHVYMKPPVLSCLYETPCIIMFICNPCIIMFIWNPLYYHVYM